jgi:tetratricopeptide (TPR) repeat protein
VLSGFAAPAVAQQILLDEFVQAGELTLYPVYKDELNFYYLPNKPRLALDDAGNPQFSFIRFVRNEETGAEDSSTSRTNDGGGIVTALIELGVSDEQRNAALRDLQSRVPGAQIKGPVMYDVGKFSLNSVFADANGDRTEQVLGIGSAPLMEGSKAAISLDLTNKGAQQLWASFDMPTPNVTFHFEMEFDGFLSPQEVDIVADYEKIYSHHALNVGAAGQAGKVLLGAEIDAAFSDLHRDQAIRVTSANPDAQMNELQKIANKFIMDTIFKPMNENNQKLPGIEAATGGVAGQGLLDKATTLLKEARATADAVRGKETAAVNDAGQCKADDVTRGAPAAQGKPESKATEKLASSGAQACEFPTKSRGRSELFDVSNDIAYLKEITRVINLPGGCKGVYHAPENLRQVNKAQELQDAKEYQNAIVLHHQIFEARPNAASVHNIALSYRLSGNVPAAKAYYQFFIDFIKASGITDRQERVEIAQRYIASDFSADSNAEATTNLSNDTACKAPKHAIREGEIFTLEYEFRFVREHIAFRRCNGKVERSESRKATILAMHKRATELYDEGEYEQAIARNRQGFQEAPIRSWLFNIAQSYRRLEDTQVARMYYQLFLEMTEAEEGTTEGVSGADEAQDWIDEFSAMAAESSTSNYQKLIRGDLSDSHLRSLDINAQTNLEEARTVFYRAQGHYVAENYYEAIREFRNAYNLLPVPHFIFNMGVSYHKAGRLTEEARRHWTMNLAAVRFLSSNAKDETERVKWETDLKKSQLQIAAYEKELGTGTPGSAAVASVSAPENAAIKRPTPSNEAPKTANVTPEAKPDNSGDKAKPAETAASATKESDCKPRKAKPAEDNRPVMSILARYQFRREKQAGFFRMNLKKYTTSSKNDNFDENIGDLSRLKNDERFFRTVNLDDDLAYDQREIVVMLNGLNSSDFDNFINFASVKLRKRHESGAETIDDVRIDKANIDRTGSKFILLYGNKGDEDRQRWLDYEFQTTWSFAGGHEEGDATFQQGNGEAIALSPPIERRSLQIEADPDALAAANVRAVDVKVFWTLGDQTDSEQVLLRLPNTSATVNMLTPGNSFGYEFEVTWMRGNGLPDLRSGRLSGSSSILFVDDVPDG